MMIEIRLKCACTNGEIKLMAPERGADEDIIKYVEKLQRLVGKWHSVRECPRTALDYLQFPADIGADP